MVYAGIVFFVNPDSIFQFDSWSYLNIANNVLESGIYSRDAAAPFIIDSTRTPFYPFFLGLFVHFGLPSWTIILAQIVVSSFTTCLIYMVTQTLRLTQKAGVIAALLFAIDPVSIFFSNTILTETLFTFLLVLGIYYFIRALKFHEHRSLYATALILSFATLCRPVSLYLIPVLGLAYLLSRRIKPVYIFKQGLVFTAICAIILGPWFMRNKMEFGRAFYCSISEINMLHYTCMTIKSEVENRPKHEISRAYFSKDLGYLNYYKDSAAIVHFRDFVHTETWRLVSENPAIFGKLALKSTFHFFAKPLRSYFDHQLFDILNYEPVASVQSTSNSSMLNKTLASTSKTTLTLVAFQILLLIFTYGAILFSIKWWYKNSFEVFLFLLLILSYFAFTATFADVDARFRMPVIPLLLILAAPSFENCLKKAES